VLKETKKPAVIQSKLLKVMRGRTGVLWSGMFSFSPEKFGNFDLKS